jgi:hypothetical protein
MNAEGANIFSEWLGQRVGEAVNQGTILIERPVSERTLKNLETTHD